MQSSKYIEPHDQGKKLEINQKLYIVNSKNLSLYFLLNISKYILNDTTCIRSNFHYLYL
jgi:hypothetical protein